MSETQQRALSKLIEWRRAALTCPCNKNGQCICAANRLLDELYEVAAELETGVSP